MYILLAWPQCYNLDARASRHTWLPMGCATPDNNKEKCRKSNILRASSRRNFPSSGGWFPQTQKSRPSSPCTAIYGLVALGKHLIDRRSRSKSTIWNLVSSTSLNSLFREILRTRVEGTNNSLVGMQRP
jgi:hypothetical protein